jgi:cytoskeletal protein RodZ
MNQAPKPVWHFSRRDEPPCVLSNQELLLLAEFGHLRGDDLLWRRDFEGWKTIRSLLGTAAPVPSTVSFASQRRSKLVSRAALISRLVFSGFLAAVVLVALLGNAFHKSLTTDTQPETSASTEAHSAMTTLYSNSTEPHSAFSEAQRSGERASANVAKQSEPEGQSQVDIIVRKVRTFSVVVP